MDGLVDAGGNGDFVGDVALEGQDAVVVFGTGGFEVVGCDSAAGGLEAFVLVESYFCDVSCQRTE